MDNRLKTALHGLAPLAIGIAAVAVSALAVMPDHPLWRECLRDLAGLAIILPPWWAVRCGLESRREVESLTLAMALFLLPAAALLPLPGRIPALFFYGIDGNFLGLPLAEWQLRLMDTVELGFAFWAGRRSYDMELVNSYYFLGLGRMALGMVQNFTAQLNPGHTDLLAPFLGFAAFPLLIMQLKAGFDIMSGIFRRSR